MGFTVTGTVTVVRSHSVSLVRGRVRRAQFAFWPDKCVCILFVCACVLGGRVDSPCKEAFKVAGSCGLNGPVRSPRRKFLEQMVGRVMDLIEKYIRASAAV